MQVDKLPVSLIDIHLDCVVVVPEYFVVTLATVFWKGASVEIILK